MKKYKILALILALTLCVCGLTACSGGSKSIADMWNNLWGKNVDNEYKPFPHEPSPNPSDDDGQTGNANDTDNTNDTDNRSFLSKLTYTSSSSLRWNLWQEPLKATSIGDVSTLKVTLEYSDKKGELYLRRYYPGTNTVTFTFSKSFKFVENRPLVSGNWGTAAATMVSASTKTVDSTEKLYVGMAVDIFSASGAFISGGVKIATVNQETKDITFEGTTGTLSDNCLLFMSDICEEILFEYPEDAAIQFVKPLPILEFGKGYKFIYDGNLSVDWEVI